VRAALDLGLDTLSMQGLADDLGVTAPALYTHVSGRDEVLTLAHAAARTRLASVTADATDWRTWLTTLAQMVHAELGPSARTILDESADHDHLHPRPNPQGRALLVRAGLRPRRADAVVWLATRVALTATSPTSLLADLEIVLDGVAAHLPSDNHTPQDRS